MTDEESTDDRIKSPTIEDLVVPCEQEYTLRWSLHENGLSLNFEVVKVGGYAEDGSRAYFMDYTARQVSVEEANEFVSGSVRFDGCVNYWFPEIAQGCMMHACDRCELVELGLVLASVRDFASKVIDQWCGEPLEGR